MQPLAGHSVLYKQTLSTEPENLHAIYSGDVQGWCPEIYGRAGNEIYIAGLNHWDIALPETANDVKPQPKLIEEVKEVANKVFSDEAKANLEVVRENLVC